jgi:hypothetical protein
MPLKESSLADPPTIKCIGGSKMPSSDPAAKFLGAKACPEKRTSNSTVFGYLAKELTANKRAQWEDGQVDVFKEWITAKGFNVLTTDITPLLRVLDLDGYEDVVNRDGESVHNLIVTKVRDRLLKTRKDYPELGLAYLARAIHSLKAVTPPPTEPPPAVRRESPAGLKSHRPKHKSIEKTRTQEMSPSSCYPAIASPYEFIGRPAPPARTPHLSPYWMPSFPDQFESKESTKERAATRKPAKEATPPIQSLLEPAPTPAPAPAPGHAHLPPTPPPSNPSSPSRPPSPPAPTDDKEKQQEEKAAGKWETSIDSSPRLRCRVERLQKIMRMLKQEIDDLPHDRDSGLLKEAALDATMEIGHLYFMVQEYLMEW